MYGITDLATFVLGTIFIVLLPGPNSLYVMTVASRQGIGPGYWGALGIFVGDALLMLAAATGAASALKAMPWLFDGLKTAGALYLGWIGLQLCRGAWKRWNASAPLVAGSPQAETTGPSASRPFRTALLISLMNPKAILFFVSFFIQFVSPDYEQPWLSFLILGTIVQCVSAIYLSALIFVGAQWVRAVGRHRWGSTLGMGLAGLLFLGFAFKLGLAGL